MTHDALVRLLIKGEPVPKDHSVESLYLRNVPLKSLTVPDGVKKLYLWNVPLKTLNVPDGVKNLVLWDVPIKTITGATLLLKDPRGYVAMLYNGKVYAGCRQGVSIKYAKTHWGKNYQGKREIGDMYLAALAKLEGK